MFSLFCLNHCQLIVVPFVGKNSKHFITGKKFQCKRIILDYWVISCWLDMSCPHLLWLVHKWYEKTWSLNAITCFRILKVFFKIYRLLIWCIWRLYTCCVFGTPKHTPLKKQLVILSLCGFIILFCNEYVCTSESTNSFEWILKI